MKKNPVYFLLFAAAFILQANVGYAQQPERCVTVLYNKLAEQKNPVLAERRNAFNNAAKKNLNAKNYQESRSIVTIPVVVHLVYRTNLENISDAQIQSQIDVLNEDFSRMNADTAMTPLVWRDSAADTEIRFCLASRKPNGDWTNGIERRQTTVMDWGPTDDVKFYSSGGLDAWDSHQYLNIWVCNLAQPFLGFTSLPGGDTLIDGAVILYRAFGRIGSITPPFHKGRTLTHEIGHWLNLNHIWGDDGGLCSFSDFVNDTPNQADFTTGCPAFPRLDSCTSSYPGVMFMNYMDYTDDSCMNMFTNGQAARMHLALDSSRPAIAASLGCTAPSGINIIGRAENIIVYPNPARNEIYIHSEELLKENVLISVFDMTGKEIFADEIFSVNKHSPLNISSLEAGVYFLKLNGQHFSRTARFVLIR